MVERLNFNFFARPSAQVILIILSSIALILMSMRPYGMFLTEDPTPTIQPVTDFNNKIIVKTSLYLKEFLTLHMTENEFLSDVIVGFEFDPQEVPLETIEKFTFSKADIIEKHPAAITQHNGKTIARYHVRLKFPTSLSHRQFPLGDHRLNFLLTNYDLDANNVLFQANDNSFVIDKGLYTPGWKYTNKQVKAGIKSFTLNGIDDKQFSLPRIAYILDFDRDNVLEALIILLPLVLIFFLILFTFAIHLTNYGEMILLTNAGLLAIVVHHFTIKTMSPNVPYFVLGDYLFMLIFILATIAVILSFNRHWVKHYEGIIVLGMHCALIAGWFYFTNIWAL